MLCAHEAVQGFEIDYWALLSVFLGNYLTLSWEQESGLSKTLFALQVLSPLLPLSVVICLFPLKSDRSALQNSGDTG